MEKIELALRFPESADEQELRDELAQAAADKRELYVMVGILFSAVLVLSAMLIKTLALINEICG